MGKRGPKGFTPTATHRKRVRLLIAGGISEPVIASELGICQNTLRKHFAGELEFGREQWIAENMARLDKAANEGNVAAMKYLDGRAAGVASMAPKQGKKDIARQAAETAGEGTDWGSDLQVPASLN